VLGAGFPTTLVSADATLQVWLERADLARLQQQADPLAQLLTRHVRLWEPVQRRLFTGLGGTLHADNAAFLHDPLTVLALVDPAPLVFEELRIVATLEAGVLRTHEVDPRLGLGAGMRVATAVDAPRASRAIADRLLAPGAPPARRAEGR
jgi:inosine-uridine nucleoside N-ribohydrolase